MTFYTKLPAVSKRGKDKLRLREGVNGATESSTVLDCGLRRIAPDHGPRHIAASQSLSPI